MAINKRKGPRPAIRGIAELLYETTPEGRQRHIMTVRGLVSLANLVPARENQDYTLMTAVYALDAFLGTDWVIKHISQPGKPGFLRAPPSDRKRQHICALRIIWLAEMLFNFQRAAGLE